MRILLICAFLFTPLIHNMSTSRSKRIPCHPQCTRCKDVLVSRSTKTRHTKDIRDRLLHASASSESLETAPKATILIPTFAEWNSQHSTRGNDEDRDEDMDGTSSERSRAVKRTWRTSTLDLGGPVSYSNSQFDVKYCVYILIILIFEGMTKLLMSMFILAWRNTTNLKATNTTIPKFVSSFTLEISFYNLTI
jgi:hypothetical protein